MPQCPVERAVLDGLFGNVGPMAGRRPLCRALAFDRGRNAGDSFHNNGRSGPSPERLLLSCGD
jgi:hypothetical protein